MTGEERTQPAYMLGRRAAVAASIVALLLVLAGCGHGNKDPRRGRVTTGHSNCLWGECYTDWKVCVGPDLLVHIDGAKPMEHTVTASPECAP